MTTCRSSPYIYDGKYDGGNEPDCSETGKFPHPRVLFPLLPKALRVDLAGGGAARKETFENYKTGVLCRWELYEDWVALRWEYVDSIGTAYQCVVERSLD